MLIYYESRLANLELKESEHPNIDPEFEEAKEGEEVKRKKKLMELYNARPASIRPQATRAAATRHKEVQAP